MSRGPSNGVSLGTGMGIGISAFVVGLVLTIVLAIAGISRYAAFLVGLGGYVNGSIISYTSFHLWPLALGGFGGSGSGSFLVWTIVPIIVLVPAGFLTASIGGGGNGFKNGASITAGYLTLTILGYLLLLLQGGASSVDFLSLFVGILFTGVLFPVVFGAIGGAIADGM